MQPVNCHSPKHRNQSQSRLCVTAQAKVICDCGQQLNLFERNVISLEVELTPTGFQPREASWSEIDPKLLAECVRLAEADGVMPELTAILRRKVARVSKQTA